MIHDTINDTKNTKDKNRYNIKNTIGQPRTNDSYEFKKRLSFFLIAVALLLP